MSETQRTTREAFMGRVTDALKRGSGGVAPAGRPVLDEAVVRVVSTDEDVVGLFESRAMEVGMVVRRCKQEGVGAEVESVLGELGIKSVVMSVGLDEEAVRGAVAGAGVSIEDGWRGDRSMAVEYEAGAGVTDVAAAIAETGSLVCRADGERGRGLSLVPGVHVAVVRASQVVADLSDYMRSLAEEGGGKGVSSSRAIITGPSKTADIEGVLITGVHGPEAVVIVLVEDA